MKTLIPHRQLLGDINRVQATIDSLISSKAKFVREEDARFKTTVDQFLVFYESQVKHVLISYTQALSAVIKNLRIFFSLESDIELADMITVLLKY